MNQFLINSEMIYKVANALGPKLLNEVVFTGGCVTGFLLTDDFTKEQVRHTKDVDVIVSVISRGGWYKLEKELLKRGFKYNPDPDSRCICEMQLDGLRVDFMPDDESILTFSNRWYKDAFQHAKKFKLKELEINLINAVYFIATKLEAYADRGANDPLESHDIEDVLNIFDGREKIIEELGSANKDVVAFISTELIKAMKNNYFEYAIESTVNRDNQREQLIIKRLEEAVNIA